VTRTAAGSGDGELAQSSDARLAASLAKRAGRLLLALREQQGGLTGGELGARGDADSNAFLLRELAAACPADAVLSEE
jgi:3'(2'), 5'-bisphosphate nucleotidase